jgi:hypothetical protein
LAVRNWEGKLTTDKQHELKNYRQVGLQLDLLWAKAMPSAVVGLPRTTSPGPVFSGSSRHDASE